MPTPSEVKPAKEVFKDSSGGDRTLYVSPNHKLSTKVYSGTGVIDNNAEASLNYAIVIDPVTKEQSVYQRDYNFFGQPNRLDPNKKLAVKGPDGTFVPTDYATGENFNENLLRRLQEDTAQATFNNVVDYTVKSSLKQTSQDGTATPTEVAEVTESPVQPNEPENPTNPAGADIEPGDGSLGSTTVTSANQDKVSNFSTDLDLVYPPLQLCRCQVQGSSCWLHLMLFRQADTVRQSLLMRSVVLRHLTDPCR